MDQFATPSLDPAAPVSQAPANRRDGWTLARKARFLELLAGHGDVRAASAGVGMSREGAYRLRRRDPLFARAWAAALPLARDVGAQALACRAIEGVEEEVWYRGELVGIRRRFDTRLLLAHLARLDALADHGDAAEDAERFDELLALVAGVQPPEEMPVDEDGLPLPLEEYAELAVDVATGMLHDELEDGDQTELTPLQQWQVAADARAQWHGWQEHCFAYVDRLLAASGAGSDMSSSTV